MLIYKFFVSKYDLVLLSEYLSRIITCLKCCIYFLSLSQLIKIRVIFRIEHNKAFIVYRIVKDECSFYHKSEQLSFVCNISVSGARTYVRTRLYALAS